MDSENALVAVFMLPLERYDNQELFAFNVAVQLYGRVDPKNVAYEKAREDDLIREDGLPIEIESLLRALACEVNQRVSEGIFM